MRAREKTLRPLRAQVLMLLEKKPQGILPMLNEEVTRRGGSDEQLLKKYLSTHGGGGGGADGVVGRFVTPRARRQSNDFENKQLEKSFGIVHYAGTVLCVLRFVSSCGAQRASPSRLSTRQV